MGLNTLSADKIQLFGTAVLVRPSVNGRQLQRATRGLIVDSWGDDDYVCVWFPSLGGLREIGKAVQPIRWKDLGPCWDLANCPSSWVVKAHRSARRDQAMFTIHVWAAERLQMAARAHRRAQQERRNCA
ncbi:hypothetical protein B1813_22785 [Saccharomonospora piscinae]|uniref:Uncharacterized protein n=1 Tax=Saccharomonospora piscinae TaxID=687388 RepID=A0A1V8ZVT8_SACPI|nr:hypothetical protein [Saccharomonospora piscinae]OQO88982.1 hypothetical protein B1813_22785 [Saccharomonospora piscinae]